MECLPRRTVAARLLLLLVVLILRVRRVSCEDVLGAGAVFLGPLYQDLIHQYMVSTSEDVHTMEYYSIGSAEGLCRIKDHEAECSATDVSQPMEIDFAAVDSPLREDDDPELYPDLLAFPTVAGAVVPVYSLPELNESDEVLLLDMETLARVYSCNISNWRDPAIAMLNPNVQHLLPDQQIQVGYMLQASGSSSIFFSALMDRVPGIAAGTSCMAGSSNHHTRDGNSRMAAFVSNTPYSLGYVDYADAVGLNLSIANLASEGCGRSVRASIETIDARLQAMELLGELSMTSTQSSTSRDSSYGEALWQISWPMVSFTYIVMRNTTTADRLRKGATCDNVRATMKLLIWIYSSNAVDDVIRSHGFSPLLQSSKASMLESMQDVVCAGETALSPAQILGVGTTTIQGNCPVQLVEPLNIFAQSYQGATVELLPAFQSDCENALGEEELFRVMACSDIPDHELLLGDVVLPYGMHSIVVMANIPEVGDLKLNLAAVAGIVDRSISHFNDPMLVRLNPALEDVTAPITLVGSLENDDVMGALKQLLRGYHTVSGSISERWDGCITAEVCLDTAVQQKHYILETPYSLTVMRGNALDVNSLQHLIASIWQSGSGVFVRPSTESLLACHHYWGTAGSSAIRDSFAGIDWETSNGCYPLSFDTYVLLHSNYEGSNSKAATQAVHFWDWVLRQQGENIQLFSAHSMLALYPLFSDEINAGLESLLVNGESVLGSQSRTGTQIMVAIGTVMGLAVAGMVVGGLAIVRRNNVLAAQIAIMKKDGSIMAPEDVWQLDVDSPILKTMKFLERLSELATSHKDRREAADLFQMLQKSDRSQIPTALLEGVHMRSDNSAPVMNYLINLTTDVGSSARRESSHSSTSNSIRALSCDVNFKSFSRENPTITLKSAIDDFQSSTRYGQTFILPGVVPEGREEDEDANRLNGLSSSFTISAGQCDISGLGASFFCNVLHLKSYGIAQPAAFVMYNIIEGKGLIESLQLKRNRLKTFLSKIDLAYQNNFYHNSWHAADVVQRTASIVNHLHLGTKGSVSSRVNVLSAIIAAGAHDVDHPGLDNKYLVRTEHPVAKRFNDQHVLENHSTNLCLELLRDPDTNFVEGSIIQEKKYWQKLKGHIIHSVLATDMANHFELLGKFNSKFMGVTPESPEFHTLVDDNSELVLQMAIKCADLGHCVSRRKTHMYWSKSLEQEFFLQGDLERESGQPASALSPLTDREGTGAMAPKNQVGFFDFIIMPLFTSMAKVFPELQPMVEQAHNNWLYWKRMAIYSEYEIKTLEQYEADMLKHSVPSSLLDMDDAEYTFRKLNSSTYSRSLQNSAADMLSE